MKNSRELPPDEKQQDTVEQDRQRGLEQIRNLGSHKPMGYLPIDSLSLYFHSSVEQEIERARQKGFRYLILSSKECDIGYEGALFIYDASSLEQLLEKNKEILVKSRWPTDPEAFVRKVASEFAGEGTKLRKVIDQAFGG
ncbi:MAG: hypothetical protein HYW90_04945 [Candidatus Sungbacteria bacterium]|nr:hypothetical protein [Candidatus Sungbacteria bacterium]